MKSQRFKLFTNHGLVTMNVCTKLYGNPSNSCQDISIKKRRCQPHSCARGSPLALGYIIREPWMSGQRVCLSIKRFWDISLNKWKRWPAGGARGKDGGSPKSLEFMFLKALNRKCQPHCGTRGTSVQNIMPSNSCIDISLWDKVVDQPTDSGMGNSTGH